jgi:regulator of sigma E protease
MSWLLTGVNAVVPVAIVLGVLITLHELGHYLAARACGVRVLKFSIGFGPPLGVGRFRARWVRGGIEYVIAWIPFGGFVKMLGEYPSDGDAGEARTIPRDSLLAAALWRKLAIVLAGPATNLALPIAVFMALLWIGVSRPAPVVGSVERTSPAAAAGIVPGDRIVAIDGTAMQSWADVETAVHEKAGATLHLSLERAGVRREVAVAAQTRSGMDIVGVPGEVGWIGAYHERQLAVVAVPSPASPAARAGLVSGDRIVSVDGVPVVEWTAFAQRYRAAKGEAALRIARGQPERESELRVPALGSADALGVTTAVIVSDVVAGSPAANAGLAPGDVLVGVDGQPIGAFQTFQDAVRASGGRTLRVDVVRAGALRTLPIAPQKMKTEVVKGVTEDVYRVGIGGAASLAQGAVELERVRNPIAAFPRAVHLTGEELDRIFTGLGHIASGRVGRDAIGGPIEIARQSKIAWDLGWEYFVGLFVLISVNLGVLNLLPIPVLDGGQAVMYTLEAVLKDRFSARAREIAQTVGLALLLTLMVFALYNDVTKHVIGFLRNL